MLDDPPIHMLVADDSSTDRMLMAAYAESFGWSAELVSTAEAAVSCAVGEPYDVMVFDHNMPGGTGVEAIRAIRAGDGPNVHTPTLIWTAGDIAAVAEAATGVRYLDLAKKPLGRSAFEAWARRARRLAPSRLGLASR